MGWRARACRVRGSGSPRRCRGWWTRRTAVVRPVGAHGERGQPLRTSRPCRRAGPPVRARCREVRRPGGQAIGVVGRLGQHEARPSPRQRGDVADDLSRIGEITRNDMASSRCMRRSRRSRSPGPGVRGRRGAAEPHRGRDPAGTPSAAGGARLMNTTVDQMRSTGIPLRLAGSVRTRWHGQHHARRVALTTASSELSAEVGTSVTTCTEESRELVAETSRRAVTAAFREEVARAREASSPSSPSRGPTSATG